MKYWLILCYLSNLSLGAREVYYPPYGFFSAMDVTTVSWAHAVNTQQLLSETLADPSIRMIEADLARGRVNISGVIGIKDVTVMSHEINSTSDLSFVSFIDQVIEFNMDKSLEEMKGVKLDFKDYFAAVGAVMTLMNKNMTFNGSPVRFPVWINADVVQGPVDSKSEVLINGVDLLNLHNISLPNSVLSLGWKTRYGLSGGEMISDGSYTREDMDRMIEVFRNFTKDPSQIEQIPVTFALRAGLAAKSLGNIMYLLNATSQRASVTLWAGADDPPANLTMLDDLIKVVGKSKMFVDLPFSLKESAAGSLGFNLVFIFLSCLIRFLICELCM